MLSRNLRLRNNRDIRNVIKNGRSHLLSGVLQLKWLGNSLLNHRIAVVVSQRVSKKSTIRNRIRRRLLGGLKQKELVGNRGFDIAVLVRPNITERIEEAREALRAFLKKL